MKTEIIKYLENYVNKNKNNEEQIKNRSMLESPTMIGYFEAKDILNLKQTLNEIREYVKSYSTDSKCKIEYYRSNLGNFDFKDDLNRILQIIDKVLGDEK